MGDCRWHEQVLQFEINAMIDEQMIVRLNGNPYPQWPPRTKRIRTILDF